VTEIARHEAAATSGRSPSVLLATLIAVSLASCFLMVPVMAVVPALLILAFPVGLSSLGCVLAQGCLLAAWLAWSERPFWQRLLWHWIVAAILYGVWVIGLALSQPGQPGLSRLSKMIGLSVPLMSIAAQMPLWIARQTLGWRLIYRERNDARATPLSIRDLMLATVLVAVALALARLAPSPDGKPIGMLWLIMFAAATTISAITLLPAGPLLMRTPRLARGVLFASFYAAFWIALPWLIVLVAWHRGYFAPPPIAVLLGLSCMVLSFAGTVILAAAAARARGYRLILGRLPRQVR
jgi:hypothetical protein